MFFPWPIWFIVLVAHDGFINFLKHIAKYLQKKNVILCPKCGKKMHCMHKDDYANYYNCYEGCNEIFVIEKVYGVNIK